MSTKRSHRIGIWVIAVMMIVGTVGSFLVMILSNSNYQADLAKQDDMYTEYMRQLEKQEKEAKELSDKYLKTFSKYENYPKSYDFRKVGDKVVKKDLEIGKGSVIKEDTKYRAYYIGWNPRGKIFDSSFNDGGESLKLPLDTSEMSLIQGWDDGVIGMRVGGVRQITIPSDLAYGEAGSGDDIPPNTPIKFIVMIIETVETAE